MKVLLATLAFAGILAVAAPARAQHRAESEQAIRKVIADAAEAWNRRDAPALGLLFAADADLVPVGGTLLKGRAEIEAHHAILLAASDKETRLAWKASGIRFLRPDVAIVRVAAEVTSGDAREKRTSYATLALTKQAGQWMIASMENTSACPPAVSAPVR